MDVIEKQKSYAASIDDQKVVELIDFFWEQGKLAPERYVEEGLKRGLIKDRADTVSLKELRYGFTLKGMGYLE